MRSCLRDLVKVGASRTPAPWSSRLPPTIRQGAGPAVIARPSSPEPETPPLASCCGSNTGHLIRRSEQGVRPVGPSPPAQVRVSW